MFELVNPTCETPAAAMTQPIPPIPGIEVLQAGEKLQMQAEMKEQLAAELIRLAALDEHQRKIFTARKEIIDTILTLSCPRCEKASVRMPFSISLRSPLHRLYRALL